MTPADLSREGVIRFDLSPCPRFCYPEDFDRDKYDAWLDLSGISGQPPVEDVLVNIEAAERAGDKLLFRNAGVLFFAKNVRHFFSEAYITCLLGKGADKVHILDRRDFDGGIVADIEDALSFIERNTRTAYRIESLRRENIPEYPMKALREAITNAVMHRDWFFEGANVFVEIYANRIEVISPGGLPSGLKPAELGRKSVRRNPLVADLLHRIEFIEKAGTGIRRIRDEAREQGCPEPKFEFDNFTTVTFRPNPEVRPDADTEGYRVAEQATGQVTPQDTPQDTPQVTPQDAGIARLLEVISGAMNRRQLQNALGLKDTKHVRKTYLLPALQAGLIEMTIPDKPRSSKQCYRLTLAGHEYLNKNFERSFAEFLDRATDVSHFAALGTTEQGSSGTSFRIDYPKPSGAIGFYYPDWVVVQKTVDGEVNWIIETKGRVWEGTVEKDAAARDWCKRVSETTGKPWKYTRINQSEFTDEHPTFGAFIWRRAIKTSGERRRQMRPVTQEEIRAWKEEGRR